MTRLDQIRACFARNDGLPFADVLTEPRIHDALDEQGVSYRDRVFSLVTTLWGFLSQVLSDDHSWRDAVSRIIAHRAASGLEACSPNTASYCNARARIPTAVLRTLARRTARELQAGAADEWNWNGRSVFIADGSHVSMPDTPENQARYPQPVVQQPGIGFPLARIAVLLSLATGACHDLAIAPYAGKGTGEITLLRAMYDALKPGDVIFADALFDNYFEVFAPSRARQLVRRIEFCYMPKHGSWLNIAENELGSLTRQCVAGRHFGDARTLRAETQAWSSDVNNTQRGVDWHMKMYEARCKLASVYPKIKL